MIPVDKLESFTRRMDELDQLLCDPDVLTDPRRMNELNRERARLEPVVAAFRRWKSLARRIAEDRDALSDPELGPLVRDELPGLEAELEQLERTIHILLLPRDPNDERNTVIEIRAGTGGEEAALFAADLFRMYSRYAESKRWKVEIASMSEASAGGIKEVIAVVSGDRVYSALRFEAGVHRVQRIPATESAGRIHTSTATVAVMPEADEVEVEINEKDLEISKTAAGGPGGQGVNTTMSAINLRHIPTGICVRAEEQRSQHQNLARAMQILRAKLYEMAERERAEAIRDERRSMVGTGERAEKIRTYNYPQNRVTDHRIQLTLHSLDRVVEGELDELITALRTHHQAELLRARADA